MTATQKKSSRRTFLKGVAAVPIGAAGIGAMSAPASATDWDDVWLAGEGGRTSAVRYVVDRVQDHFGGLGSGDDYADAEFDSAYLQMRADIDIIQSGNDNVLTQAQNLTENAKSVGYQIGRSKLIERLNEGDSMAEARPTAEDAITEYFVPTQENIIDRWNVVMLQLELAVERGDELEDYSGSDIVEASLSDDLTRTPDFRTEDYSLLDGSMEVYYVHIDGGEYNEDGHYKIDDRSSPSFSDHTGELYSPSNSDLGYDRTDIFEQHGRWDNLLSDLNSKYNETIDELRDFADGIQDSYAAGDIDTEDLVTPRDLWEMSSDDSDNPYAAADLAGLGLEINQDSSVQIYLSEEDLTLEGDLFLSKSPIDESVTVGNWYDPNLSRSTDEDGDPNDTIEDYEATEDDPIPLDGLAYFAYNLDEGSTYNQITEPFEVVEAFDPDGEELQNVAYEPSTGQQTTTTDIDELRDELQSINDELIRVEEERAELASSGGGGGFLSGDGNENIIIAAAAAVGAWFVLGGGGGS